MGSNNIIRDIRSARPSGDFRETVNPVQDYDHKVMVRQVLKVISDCPMGDDIKMVMRMKVWGVDPNVWRPLSYEEIAFMSKKGRMPVNENELHAIVSKADIDYVGGLETEGKSLVAQHLFLVPMEEIEARYDREAATKTRQLFELNGKVFK